MPFSTTRAVSDGGIVLLAGLDGLVVANGGGCVRGLSPFACRARDVERGDRMRRAAMLPPFSGLRPAIASKLELGAGEAGKNGGAASRD